MPLEAALVYLLALHASSA